MLTKDIIFIIKNSIWNVIDVPSDILFRTLIFILTIPFTLILDIFLSPLELISYIIYRIKRRKK